MCFSILLFLLLLFLVFNLFYYILFILSHIVLKKKSAVSVGLLRTCEKEHLEGVCLQAVDRCSFGASRQCMIGH